MKSSTLLPIYLLHLSPASALPPQLPLHQPSTLISPQIQSHNTTLPLDHFPSHPSNTTPTFFTNRYFLNTHYHRPGGPILFHDFGEAGVSDTAARAALSENDAATTVTVELAKRFHGLIVGWEHRFYGRSVPGGLDGSGGVDVWRYLTVEQALEDVVYFAKRFALPVPLGHDGAGVAQGDDVSPSKTPWIWVGGSYAGMRGAMLRLRNPEVFYAVWASSATVQARNDMGVYYNPIFRSMSRNCSGDVHAVVQYVDGILASGQEGLAGNLKKRVFAMYKSIGSIDDVYNISEGLGLEGFDVGKILADPIISDFQNRGPSATVHRFCDWMESYNPAFQPEPGYPSDPNPGLIKYMRGVLLNPGNSTSNRAGIVSRHGLETGLNAYLYAARLEMHAVRSRLDPNSTAGKKPYGQSLADARSWQWQALTEIGNSIGSQSGKPWNMVSRFIDVDTERRRSIEANFPAFDRSVFPHRSNVQSMLRYGGWDMRPSHVMFTNGEFDPWRSITVASEEESIGAPMRRTVQDVPECGDPPSGDNVFGIVYKGMAHVSDFRKDKTNNQSDTPLDLGVELFSKALEKWLPCFSGTADGAVRGQRVLAGPGHD